MQISCLLLAAGRSSRMLGPNKLLLTLHGQSLVRRTALEICKMPFKQIVAVTGHDSEKVSREIEDLPLQIVFNAHHLSGMHSSIRTGLEALTEPSDGFFVCLSDQPGFSHEVLKKMMVAFEENLGKKIIYPSYAGERGQPVLIPQSFVPEILGHADGDHGCNYLFKKYPEQTQEVILEKPEALVDVDTPEQYSLAVAENYG